MKSRKKAQIWVSAILYILIIVISITLILEAGIPVLNNLRDRAAFTEIKDNLLGLNQHIKDISSEGPGSQRVIPIEVNKGEVTIADDKITWELKTKEKVVDPGQRLDIGNLVITSNVDVTSKETVDSYIMQNTHLYVNISKLGTKANYTNISTSDLIRFMKYKDNNEILNGTFNFIVAGNSTSGSGNGYTAINPSGNNSNIDSATVTAYMNTTSFIYELKFILESQSDFLKVDLKNVEEVT